ncbi:unnamed protein product [Staurois parvus]|uniref:Uncharacterized protein n=1 Tax=Staurois parvus TaxID=386267 RepID=A0ABN9GZX8_9NEOB|nr:unnamed protein product [Staurois parvus]
MFLLPTTNVRNTFFPLTTKIRKHFFSIEHQYLKNLPTDHQCKGHSSHCPPMLGSLFPLTQNIVQETFFPLTTNVRNILPIDNQSKEHS